MDKAQSWVSLMDKGRDLLRPFSLLFIFAKASIKARFIAFNSFYCVLFRRSGAPREIRLLDLALR